MKVKLLKKTRKRFEIIHMPDGITTCGERYEYNLYKLADSSNDYFEHWAQLGLNEGERQFQSPDKIFETEKECIDYLKSVILYKLRKEGHRGVKDNRMKDSHRKVWYK